MTVSTFAKQYLLFSGDVLEVPDSTLEHLQAHPEVTPEILEAAVSQLVPPSSQGVFTIDLEAEFGLWGKSGLVEVSEVSLFAFRKGRIAPSPVVDHPGVPASKLAIVTKPTDDGDFLLISCWCTDGKPAKPEPITPSVDPRTQEGIELRQEFLQFWSGHALALGVAPIEGEPFHATWDEVITQWGDVYHK
jgi:hypothetical protein